MSVPRRFLIWFLSALAVFVGAAGLGYFLPASGHKISIVWGVEIALDLAVAWRLGLLRFRTSAEISIAVLVTLLAVAMLPILTVLAILSTLLCGIDACSH
jgi:hypothetical protein